MVVASVLVKPHFHLVSKRANPTTSHFYSLSIPASIAANNRREASSTEVTSTDQGTSNRERQRGSNNKLRDHHHADRNVLLLLVARLPRPRCVVCTERQQMLSVLSEQMPPRFQKEA
jgi:hypothetical protein